MTWSPAEAAAYLQSDAAEMWLLSIGPHTATSGFQVEPVEFLDPVLGLRPGFQSTLFGGRSVFGTAEHVRRCMRMYIASRAKKAPRDRVSPSNSEPPRAPAERTMPSDPPRGPA